MNTPCHAQTVLPLFRLVLITTCFVLSAPTGVKVQFLLYSLPEGTTEEQLVCGTVIHIPGVGVGRAVFGSTW